MSTETNPLLANAGAADVTAPDGKKDGSADVQGLSLGDLNIITGREYKTREDAMRHIKELNSLIGDDKIATDRKLAEEYSKILGEYAANDGLSRDEARKELLANLNKERKEKPQEKDSEASRLSRKISNLEYRLEKEDFLRAYPKAEKLVSVIADGARATGVTLEEYYKSSGLKDLVISEEAEKNPTVNAKPRIQKTSAKVSQLAKAAKESPTDDNKQALVEEYLGIKR